MKLRANVLGVIVAASSAAIALGCDNPYERELGIGQEGEEEAAEARRDELRRQEQRREEAIEDQGAILQTEEHGGEDEE